jgi:Cdc6-like AAA superfamily ATPase
MSSPNPDSLELEVALSRAFRPSAPVDRAALFSGRTEQIRRLISAISQPGQHAVLFGERGVGKTSLVNVLSELLSQQEQVIAPHINCDGTDTFSSVWRKVFSNIRFQTDARQIGFTGGPPPSIIRGTDYLPPGDVTPDDVRYLLTLFGQDALLIVILDEFDRLPNGRNSQLFADTIKVLSDQVVPATLIFVGVADSVTDLIREHASIERSLVQIRLPRMSRKELRTIIEKGLDSVGMTIDTEAADQITALSQGLPHFTHLLGLYAAQKALDVQKMHIGLAEVGFAIQAAVGDVQQTILTDYLKATASPRKNTLFPQVLLACAQAQADELGFFAAADVRTPLRTITGENYDIPAFARHLNEFCLPHRGPVLKKYGDSHRVRFRFVNPLMQPFILLKGMADGMISPESL